MHRSILALALAPVFGLAACGGHTHAAESAVAGNPHLQKDRAVVTRKVNRCVAKLGLFSLRSKEGRQVFVACVVPARQKVQAQACLSKNLRLTFSKKKFEGELTAATDCIARLK